MDGGGRFEEGTLAMFIDGPETASNLRSLAEGLDWDIGPLPQKVKAATILRGEGACLPAKAAHPELAWKLNR